MGDFEDVFGAGADASAIIDSFSRQEMRYRRQRDADEDQVVKYDDSDDAYGADSWADTNKGIYYFATYDEAIAWEKVNKGVVWIRRRKGLGYLLEITRRS